MTPDQQEELLRLQIDSGKSGIIVLDNEIMELRNEMARFARRMAALETKRAELWYFIQMHDKIVMAEVPPEQTRA